MPTYNARATVLKKTKLGETDLIITLIATDGRELRAVAKGARKPGSKLGARVEPFTVLEGQFAVGRNLDIVSDVRTVTPHASLRDDYDKLLVASVAAEMLQVVAEQAQATEFLYQMSSALFDVMDASPAEVAPQLLAAWMLKLFAVLGYRPILEECAICGRAVSQPPDKSDPVTFVSSAAAVRQGDGSLVSFINETREPSPCLTAAADATSAATDERFCWSAEAGGVICVTCGAGQFIPLESYPAAALAWLRTLLGATFAEAAAYDLLSDLLRDLFTLTITFAQEHFPAKLKALEFFQQQYLFNTPDKRTRE
ncbi:MAG: DNA repair protein RecO [Coriobacteriia bacterium]|nr:DNA repair protein RecO [Coriobacteriia bacterium]